MILAALLAWTLLLYLVLGPGVLSETVFLGASIFLGIIMLCWELECIGKKIVEHGKFTGTSRFLGSMMESMKKEEKKDE